MCLWGISVRFWGGMAMTRRGGCDGFWGIRAAGDSSVLPAGAHVLLWLCQDNILLAVHAVGLTSGMWEGHRILLWLSSGAGLRQHLSEGRGNGLKGGLRCKQKNNLDRKIFKWVPLVMCLFGFGKWTHSISEMFYWCYRWLSQQKYVFLSAWKAKVDVVLKFAYWIYPFLINNTHRKPLNFFRKQGDLKC